MSNSPKETVGDILSSISKKVNDLNIMSTTNTDSLIDISLKHEISSCIIEVSKKYTTLLNELNFICAIMF